MNEVTNALPSHLTERVEESLPKAKHKLGKDDFMRLLMTQLRHQDPLNPMDHKGMITQLAQFGTLEQLTNIEKGIQGLQSGFAEDAKTQALGMIGKKVDANGQTISLSEGKPIAIKHSLPPDYKAVRATIYNGVGQSIRTLDLSSLVQGSGEINWDGKNAEGEPQPSGEYTFKVLGVDKDGRSKEVGTDVSGKVTGVELRGDKPILIVDSPSGSVEISMDKVRRISMDSGNRNSSLPAAKGGGRSIPMTSPVAAAAAKPSPKVAQNLSPESSWEELNRAWKGLP